MKKQLKISIAHSGSADRFFVGGKDSCVPIKDFLESNGAEATGSSAGELNQSDGLLCVITDNDYEEVRKCLNYALDKEKPIAYYLDDSVTLDGGMQLQLGLAVCLGDAATAAGRLKDWLRQLETIRKKRIRKKRFLFAAAGIPLLALLIFLVFFKPDRGGMLREEEVSATAAPEAIHIEDADTLTTLDLSGRKIADISFLQDFVNLEELNLANNEITDISVLAKLKKLKKLDISNNRITDINILLALPELTEVKISGNPIEDDTVLDYMKDISWKK